MKKIAVVTATRAEYGLLRNVIKKIHKDSELELILLVTGTHLLEQYGYTVSEIEKDEIPITEIVPIMSESDNLMGISKTMANASVEFAKVFERVKPDCLVVLGDRYELLAICATAMNARIPMAHISGGETTEGAVDEAVRHCITKMSYLHFPGCEAYRKRVIQLGEDPERVFNYGDLGVENVLSMDYMSREALAAALSFSLEQPYFSVTFHPITLSYGDICGQMQELLDALDEFPQYRFVFTKSNSDLGNSVINKMIDSYVERRENCVAFASLGVRKYLSLLKYAKGIIGNSSSGIAEAPTLRIPTINIGDRQRGRLRAQSVIDCEGRKQEIVQAIQTSQTQEFWKIVQSAENPYGEGDTSGSIVNKLKEYVCQEKIDLKKKFYDIDF